MMSRPIVEVIARCICAQEGFEPDGGARTGYSWINYENRAKQIVRALMRNTEYEIRKQHFMEAEETLTRETGAPTASWLTLQKTHKKADLSVVTYMEVDEFINLATLVELPFK